MQPAAIGNDYAEMLPQFAGHQLVNICPIPGTSGQAIERAIILLVTDGICIGGDSVPDLWDQMTSNSQMMSWSSP
jgi:hypothetical protein